MVARVATFALSNTMIAAALQTQAKVSERQIQTASGLVSSDYGGLGATSKKVIDLQVSVTQSKSYEDAATSASNRVEVMYSSVGSIVDLLNSYKSQLTAAVSVNDDSASLKESARNFMSEMASILNTQYGGRYLFAGATTTSMPVDLSVYSNTTSAADADTSYYRGDNQIASVKVSDGQTISYGVTADNSAFEQVMRAFSMIANDTSSTIDTSTICSALELATSALDAVTSVQTKLSLTASQLDRAVSNQQSFQDYASTLASSLTEVDVAAVTAEISTYQAQLEASYSAISKIASLRLTDYLR